VEKIELVEIEGLSYWYPGRREPALSDVSLGLSPGEFVLLVGASGSGKSTLCRAVNGLVPHFYGGRIAGHVKVAGMDTASTEVRDLARVAGMVFQDPENQMVAENLVSEVAFGLENIGLDRLQMRKRVEEVLASLRLSSLRDKRVSELSGGEKQKVALASVLVMHPQVLILDEPTSQLDPISADDFLSTLKSLNDELGLVVLLAEHRVERCFHFADRVVVMDGGRIEFAGEPGEMASWSKGKRWVMLPPITRLFLDGEDNNPPLTVKAGRMKVAELAGNGSRAGREPPAAGTEAASESPRARKKTGGGRAPLIVAHDLWHVYDNGTEALRGVDLEIEQGEFVAVMGENGSGKSTLVKHFNGLLRPSKGRVLVEGLDTRKAEVAQLARTCGMLGQNPRSQLIADNSEAELEASLRAMRVPRESWGRMIDETLKLLEIEPFRDFNPEDLSCGERERVALASVLVYGPRMLVLDEPTRGVDQKTKERLSEHLRRYNSEGNTVVLVTHDLEFAAECCTRVLLMGGGRILADGDKHRVLAESLFFTTQYNKCFRGVADGVVTREEALRALEVIT
jgi:energy-coupling factor transport system ATP-binding protein